MATEPSYTCDTEFIKLLTRRADVDLTLVALELARDAYPELEFAPVLQWIDDRAHDLEGGVARARLESELLELLGEHLAVRHGLFGDSNCFHQVDSSYLHRVIETGRGLPITLSILYMAVAGRVGIELKGVSAPMHFLTRYESVDGPLYVDAFGHGRVLSQSDCVKWVREIAQLDKASIRASLKPVGPRTIVIRMLNNLKALYAQQEKWTPAWMVQHRLAALQPCSYQERRDLALISIRANRPGHAIDLLRSCLQTCPAKEKETLELHLQEANVQVCRWN
jgi:regulator of sirC expression with transglutaminase-like and TPR domain